ncbi:tagaturonate reductase [Sinomicrobium weinanense]|uniref:Tagaturonate reductase n=1 Tax=Sinomicrobium weinanense TaxID=2842200 RepID=A0A926Q474_9FLAO|nr:tagaturonate reductase [Sinomicrobium weinanense]MBC9798323.1 tagaturonate reductase [Sinomicrobium weinanense]MBU3125573.1 tagaturonate reductase [Sinomicrobium weinanense]
MKNLERNSQGLKEKLPVKIIQFGEGNFLRAFVDYIIDKLNTDAQFKAGVAVVQPLENGLVDLLNEQEGLYTLFMKGVKKGEEIQEQRLISCIQQGVDPYADFNAYIELAKEEELQFIISNTTEAGIAFDEKDTPDMQPPSSFPGKLTVLLYERFKYFNGDPSKGLTLIPCELINNNADALKEVILKYVDLWELGAGFRNWIEQHNSFHNTLVDRIVPGYPKDQLKEYQSELSYEDKLMVSAETFLLWVIEGGEELKAKIPLDKAGLDIKIVDSIQPYRTRKVRILNGAHTAMVPFSLLYGHETVKETIDDEFTGQFVKNTVFDEIIPTLHMERGELVSFAEEIMDRFRNPFIKHYLSSIALNSISKFRVRVLPSLTEYYRREGKLPGHLIFALACLIRFYKGQWKGKQLPVQDSAAIIKAFEEAWALSSFRETTSRVLADNQFWGENLTQTVPGLEDAVVIALEQIEKYGVEEGLKNYMRSLGITNNLVG